MPYLSAVVVAKSTTEAEYIAANEALMVSGFGILCLNELVHSDLHGPLRLLLYPGRHLLKPSMVGNPLSRSFQPKSRKCIFLGYPLDFKGSGDLGSSPSSLPSSDSDSDSGSDSGEGSSSVLMLFSCMLIWMTFHHSPAGQLERPERVT